MQVISSRLGVIEVDENKLIRFENGLPGFEERHLFTLVQTDTQIPFSYLQSVEDGELSFIVVDPFVFFPDYKFDLPGETVNELQIQSEKDVMVMNIVSIPDKLENATINLIAPVVLNQRTGQALQMIIHDGSYQVKQPLLPRSEQKQR